MAEGFNRVFLLGNLGADPELKVTQGGTAVLKLRLATSERYLDRNGVRQERTEWHNVIVWGKRGEALHKILGKGSTILVEGSIRNSSYEDRDGNKRYRSEISATNIVLSGRGGARPSPTGEETVPRARSAAPPDDSIPPDPGGDFPNDDDIPF